MPASGASSISGSRQDTALPRQRSPEKGANNLVPQGVTASSQRCRHSSPQQNSQTRAHEAGGVPACRNSRNRGRQQSARRGTSARPCKRPPCRTRKACCPASRESASRSGTREIRTTAASARRSRPGGKSALSPRNDRPYGWQGERFRQNRRLRTGRGSASSAATPAAAWVSGSTGRTPGQPPAVIRSRSASGATRRQTHCGPPQRRPSHQSSPCAGRGGRGGCQPESRPLSGR